MPSSLSRASLLPAPTISATVNVNDDTQVDVSVGNVRGAASYLVREDGTQISTAQSVTRTGRTRGQTYTYSAACIDASGREGPSASVVVSIAPAASGGTVVVIHEDDFGDAKMRSNYAGSPSFGGSVPQTAADYVGTNNPRWNVSATGDLCFNRDALMFTSTAHARSPAFVSRSAKCQLTLDRVSDPGKIERNEIIEIPYAGSGSANELAMMRGNEYWMGFSIYLPGSADGADEWIAGDVYTILFQLKRSEFIGTGAIAVTANPLWTIGPDYGYKASEGGVSTAWRVVVKGYTGTTVGGGVWRTFETSTGSIATDKGKWTDWVIRVVPEYRDTWVDGNGVTQYATTEIWKDDVKIVSRIGYSNCVYNATGQAYAPKQGIYCGFANLNYVSGPASKYVHYRGEWKHIRVVGNSSGVAVDTDNFAYQAVKPRGLRSAGT